MESTKQNCFVQIRDKRKWEQTVDFLHEIGIKPYPEKDHPNFIGNGQDFLFVIGDFWTDSLRMNLILKSKETAIDCGKNIELFLTIVRMRNKSDNGQYFVTTDRRQWVNQGIYMPEGSMIVCYEDEIKDKNARRATAEEIVEFFKKFPNGMPRLTKVSDEERERMRINSYDPLL